MSDTFFPIRIKYCETEKTELVRNSKDLPTRKPFVVLETNALDREATIEACRIILGDDVTPLMLKSYSLPIVMENAVRKAFAYNMQGEHVEELRRNFRGLQYEGKYFSANN